MKQSIFSNWMAPARYFQAATRLDTRPLSTAETSQIISFSRISLIIGLVFLHYDRYPNVSQSPFRGMDPEAHQLATFVNSFVLFFFFSVVPLLSMVSGWLFFSFDSQVGKALGLRIWRRCKSLYLPLILWNLFYLTILWLAFISDPAFALFDELNLSFKTATLPDYVNAVFGVTRHPIGFQFWFVRDLFVTVLVSPLLWLLLKFLPWIGAVVLGAVWLSGFDLWIFFRTDVVFFFYLGGLLRMRKLPLEISGSTTLTLLAIYLLLVVARTLVPLGIEGTPLAIEIATRAMRLVGVAACWGIFQHIALSPAGTAIARFGGFAFFLHAAHYPLLATIKIWLWALIPAQTDAWMLLHYAASVIVTVALGITLGLALNRFAPQSFAFLNGGRLVP